MEPGLSPGADSHPDNSVLPVRRFDIALIHASVTYNRYGWHDPHAAFIVLLEELERRGGVNSFVQKAESNKIDIEPLVIRANTGEPIELRITHFPHPVHTVITQIPAHPEPCTILLDDSLFSPARSRAHAPGHPSAFGALLIEEAGTTFHDRTTGEELPSGTQAVIRRSDGTCFREFTLFVHDTGLLPARSSQSPDPRDTPFMGINYRSEPASKRLERCADPAYLFSSLVHEDPSTPILETYPGDSLLLRLITIGSRQSPRHPFHTTGMDWKPESFEWISPCASCQIFTLNQPYDAGDRLYTIGGHSSIKIGLWGILRVYGTSTKQLKPITGGCHTPLSTVPSENDVLRKYEIAVIQKKKVPRKDLLTNKPSRHFVCLTDARREEKRRHAPEPLVLKADAGDWIEVTLHNCLDARSISDTPGPSLRVSLFPQFLRCDPIYSPGINIGRNKWEQTVAPGEKKKYLWHADQEYGSCLIRSFDSICCPQSDQLFATITIEPSVFSECIVKSNPTEAVMPTAASTPSNESKRLAPDQKSTISLDRTKPGG